LLEGESTAGFLSKYACRHTGAGQRRRRHMNKRQGQIKKQVTMVERP